MALELSNESWRIAFGDGNKRRHVTIDADDLMALQAGVEQAKIRFRLAELKTIVVFVTGRGATVFGCTAPRSTAR